MNKEIIQNLDNLSACETLLQIKAHTYFSRSLAAEPLKKAQSSLRPFDPRTIMSKITPQDRPTFKVAHLYDTHGLISRETFLNFQTTFEEIVNTIVNCRDDVELWKYVRSLFEFDDYADTVPINAANLSITFNAVQVFMNAMALDWNRDISIQKRIKPFVYTIQAARALIASQLNIEPELLAFQRNGSDPNAVINNGMDFNPGDEVVVWNENHPTDGEVAWKIRKDRFPNINIVKLDLEGETDEDKIVQKFLSKVNEHTRLVTFSEVSADIFFLFCAFNKLKLLFCVSSAC